MEDRLKYLKDVMRVQTTSYDVGRMNAYIKDFVKQVPDCKLYKNNGNLYVTRGHAEIYPCVVAHTDTVHDIHKEFHVKRHNDALYAINQRYERVGIGGDDKVGVFVALEILRTTPVCKVAFFRDEEVGCQGSKLSDMKFFKDVAFVLQCDRRGYSDFVSDIFNTSLYNLDFSTAVEPYLIKYDKYESDGGLTDVYQLVENGLDVACANMSCGYYDPHTDNEFIIISEVFLTLDFVKDLVDNLSYQRWIVKKSDRNSYSSVGMYNEWDWREYNQTRKGRKPYKDEWDSGLKSFNDDFETFEDDDVSHLPRTGKCAICEEGGDVVFDDTVGMFWCFNCNDYVDEDCVDYNLDDEDSFLDIVNRND